ncbi:MULTISPECIES: FISUMP domain-containing protein [unclassified Fibrobacter]|uniref:FISUMP domain-containing protein n=1 Tax=unclassified Fibrobacter TaxID=2634177 RepID=UPI000D6AD261|nr:MULTISPECIES: FISUMP domain-containing protein [unclassified Fibrobacter]PWJ71659.1 uncharacterized protein (TIGR02145 family) [Fibrobacter sp. UWR4]PZW65103.1 uncharacterized protein (TIGR02145 family) [Fibrobacter sp. UWR1]
MRKSFFGILLVHLIFVLFACSGGGSGISDSDDYDSDSKEKSCSSTQSVSSSSGKSQSGSSSADSDSNNSSSSKKDGSSSSGNSAGSSSDSDSSDDSSSSKVTSSSDAKKEIAVAKIMPRGTYSCKQHRCCPTEHLNEEMLEQGYYGEALDERTNVVFPTLRVGYQNWMVVNLSIVNNSCDSSGQGFYPEEVMADDICPKGWHVASPEDWIALSIYYSDVMGIKEWPNMSHTGPDKLGLGFTNEAIRMDAHNSSLGGFYYWAGHNASFSVHGTNPSPVSCSGYRSCYGMHVRCVENPEKILPCRGDDFDTCSYGELLDARDGEVYKTVTIGQQTWMNESLRYMDSIATPSLKGNVYTFDSVAGHEDLIAYGYAGAMDSLNTGCGNGVLCGEKKGICPDGWHIISQEDASEVWYWSKVFSGYQHGYKSLRYAKVGTHGLDYFDYYYALGDAAWLRRDYGYWLSTENDESTTYALEIFSDEFKVHFLERKNNRAFPLRCAKDREWSFRESGMNGAFKPEAK